MAEAESWIWWITDLTWQYRFCFSKFMVTADHMGHAGDKYPCISLSTALLLVHSLIFGNQKSFSGQEVLKRMQDLWDAL